MSIYIQKNTSHLGYMSAAGGGGAQTGSISFISANTSGNDIVVFITASIPNIGSPTSCYTMADSAGNSYTCETTNTWQNGFGAQIFYCHSCTTYGAGNSVTLTATSNAMAGYVDIAIFEYPYSGGLRTTGETTAYGNLGTAIPYTTMSGTTSGDNCVMIYCAHTGTSTVTGSFGANSASGIYVPDPNGDNWLIQEGTSDGSSPMTCTASTSNTYWEICAIAMISMVTSGSNHQLMMMGVGS